MFIQFNAQFATTKNTPYGRVTVFGPKGFDKRSEAAEPLMPRKTAMEEALMFAAIDYRCAEGVQLNLVSCRGDDSSLIMRFEVFDGTVRLGNLDEQLAAVYAKQARNDRGYTD